MSYRSVLNVPMALVLLAFLLLLVMLFGGCARKRPANDTIRTVRTYTFHYSAPAPKGAAK